VRPSDTVARLGGDEFVILCDDVDDEEHAVAVAHRVAAAIESSPYYIGNTNLAISASIGIAMAAGGAGHPEALLRDADAAMYRAKTSAGPGSRSTTRPCAAARRTGWSLSRAAGGGHRAGRQSSSASSRGSTPARGASPASRPWPAGSTRPAACSPRASSSAWPRRPASSSASAFRVLSTACEHGRRWEELYGPGAPRVHVNLSARQLTTSNLPVLVQGVLDGSGLTPSQLWPRDHREAC